MKLDKQNTLPAAIPSMGGREIGPFLHSLARRAPANSHVVELGTWLGAGAAQLAQGLKARPGPGLVELSCYDRWGAPTPEEAAAAAEQGLELISAMNTLPLVEEALSDVFANICYHRGDIGQTQWEKGPIALFVDDIGDEPETARHALRTFGPHWMAGHCVVVFMGMADTTENAAARGCPRARLMLEHPESFREVFADLGSLGRAWFYARALAPEAWKR